MKRVLIVVTRGEVGGAQRSVLELARQLHAREIEVVVGFGEGSYLENALARKNIPVVHFTSLKRSRNPFLNLRFAWEIHRYLAQHPVNAVHFNSSNTLFGAIGAQLSRPSPKTVFTFRGLSVLDSGYKTNWVIKKFYWVVFKVLLQFIDEKVFVSHTNFEAAKKMKLISSGYVIYNSVTPPIFLSREEAIAALQQKIGVSLDSTFLIGSIGRLAYPKNYEFLISLFPELLQKIPEAKLVIIGEGPERKKYENLIARHSLGDKIILAGAIEDASRYLKAFDLFVLPSLYEGMSLTLIEALHAGVPVLASDVGGNKELLGDAGKIYPPGDSRACIESMIRIALINEEKTALSGAAEHRKKQFSVDAMAENYRSLFFAGK